MLALVFDENVMLREDYPEPTPAGDEALIAVRLAGVCSTDVEITKGYMGFRGVMGHEFVGQVIDGPPQWKAKRVVGEINCVCTQCDMCRSGLSNHCRQRTVIGIDGRDGVFAERVALPARNLHEVPAGVSDEQAVFAEPLAAAVQVLRQVKLDPAGRVVVLGGGRLGQLLARVLKQKVPGTVLVGKHPAKLEAAEKAGIQSFLLDEFVPSGEADVVVDATGSASGFALAMRTVRPRGTIVLKSTSADATALNLAPLVVDEVTVVGSRCGPIPLALRSLAAGEIDVDPLISRRLPLSQGTEALAAATDARTIKVLIDVAG